MSIIQDNAAMACFFGFGSLVNTATHKYEPITPATVSGWARAWINNNHYEYAFLSVTPEVSSNIQGLMAGVPNADWAELDLRETGYDRRVLSSRDWCPTPAVNPAMTARLKSNLLEDVQIYQHASGDLASDAKPILYSYLETVLFGYYQWFGAAGVTAFIDSTRGWVKILDDRSAPHYPRHVPPEGEAVESVIDAIESLR